MTEKNMAKADFYTSIVLMAFGISFTVMALQMPIMTGMGQSPHSSPGVVPAFLGVVITGLSLIMCIRSIVRTKGKLGVSGTAVKSLFTETATFRIISTIILCLAFAFLLGKIYFPLLAFLFIFGFIVFFEYDHKSPFKLQVKKLIIAAAVAICASAAITVLFQYLFLVWLP